MQMKYTKKESKIKYNLFVWGSMFVRIKTGKRSVPQQAHPGNGQKTFLQV